MNSKQKFMIVDHLITILENNDDYVGLSDLTNYANFMTELKALRTTLYTEYNNDSNT